MLQLAVAQTRSKDKTQEVTWSGSQSTAPPIVPANLLQQQQCNYNAAAAEASSGVKHFPAKTSTGSHISSKPAVKF